MIWQRVRFALLAAMLVAAAALPVRAEDDKKPATGEVLKTAPTPAPAPAQAFCTVYVKELVPEPYTCTKTVYKTVSNEEKYTAYKCVQVPVEKSRTVTVYKTVAETKPVTRKVVTCVPTIEEKTTMVSHWVTHQVTVMEKKCVDKGHYECKEVPCGPSFSERMHHLTAKHSCECEPVCEPCPRTKTVKCWVPCPTYIDVPKCKTEKVCETKPVTCKVTVYKTVEKEETCNVTVNKCVAEQKVEKYTCYETKQVPYEATRTVTKCVPVQETVTGTRMVCKTVAKQVPAAPACTPCCEPTTCCKPKWYHFGH